jgi:hypothetical protein
MARLKTIISDDDDTLPELEILLERPTQGSEKASAQLPGIKTSITTKGDQPFSKPLRSSRTSDEDDAGGLKPKQKTEAKEGGIKKQRALRKIADNSVLLRPFEDGSDRMKKPQRLQSPGKEYLTSKQAGKLQREPETTIEAPKKDDESIYKPEIDSEDDDDESIVVPTRRQFNRKVENAAVQISNPGNPSGASVNRDNQALIKPSILAPSKTSEKTKTPKLFHPQNTTSFPLSRPTSSDQDMAALLI